MTVRLHERLKKLRLSKQMSQQHVADLIGVPRGTYTHYELGRRTPDLELLMKLATLYQVSLDYLVGYTDRMPTPEEWASEHSDLLNGSTRTAIYLTQDKQKNRMTKNQVADRLSETNSKQENPMC